MVNQEREGREPGLEDLKDAMAKYLPSTLDGRRKLGMAFGKLASGDPEIAIQGFNDLMDSFKGSSPKFLGVVHEVAGQLAEEFTYKPPDRQRPN